MQLYYENYDTTRYYYTILYGDEKKRVIFKHINP